MIKEETLPTPKKNNHPAKFCGANSEYQYFNHDASHRCKDRQKPCEGMLTLLPFGNLYSRLKNKTNHSEINSMNLFSKQKKRKEKPAGTINSSM